MDDRRQTIAVDFDGVIADYDGWEATGAFGSPRADVIEALTILRSEGWRIVVHSCRSSVDIAPYLKINSVPFLTRSIRTLLVLPKAENLSRPYTGTIAPAGILVL